MARMSKRVRDAETGRFVSDQEAHERPANTEVEKMKIGRTKKRK